MIKKKSKDIYMLSAALLAVNIYDVCGICRYFFCNVIFNGKFKENSCQKSCNHFCLTLSLSWYWKVCNLYFLDFGGEKNEWI